MGGFSLWHWIVVIILVLLAVRRQPLLGHDGRRRQRAEELQAGHGGRGREAGAVPPSRASCRASSSRSTSRRARRAAEPAAPTRRRPRATNRRARTAHADVRRRHVRTADRRGGRAAVHRPEGPAAGDEDGRPLGRQDPRHGAPFHRRHRRMVREAELEEMEKQWREENERIMREYPADADHDAARPRRRPCAGRR